MIGQAEQEGVSVLLMAIPFAIVVFSVPVALIVMQFRRRASALELLAKQGLLEHGDPVVYDDVSDEIQLHYTTKPSFDYAGGGKFAVQGAKVKTVKATDREVYVTNLCYQLSATGVLQRTNPDRPPKTPSGTELALQRIQDFAGLPYLAFDRFVPEWREAHGWKQYQWDGIQDTEWTAWYRGEVDNSTLEHGLAWLWAARPKHVSIEFLDKSGKLQKRECSFLDTRASIRLVSFGVGAGWTNVGYRAGGQPTKTGEDIRVAIQAVDVLSESLIKSGHQFPEVSS